MNILLESDSLCNLRIKNEEWVRAFYLSPWEIQRKPGVIIVFKEFNRDFLEKITFGLGLRWDSGICLRYCTLYWERGRKKGKRKLTKE